MATAYDLGVAMTPQPQFTWSIASGGVGQINNSGSYQGPTSGNRDGHSAGHQRRHHRHGHRHHHRPSRR